MKNFRELERKIINNIEDKEEKIKFIDEEIDFMLEKRLKGAKTYHEIRIFVKYLNWLINQKDKQK